MRVAHVIADVGGGCGRVGAEATIRSFEGISKNDQAARVGKREWTQQDALHDGEDSGRQTNSQGQRRDSGEGEPGRLAQLAQRIANVSQGLGQSLIGALVAMQLLGLFHSSISAPGGETSLGRREALAPIVIF